MRIVSKFRDYYDSAGAFTYAPEPVYIRERSTTRLKAVERSMLFAPRLCNFVLIGFCGKVYPAIKVSDCSVVFYSFESCVETATKFMSCRSNESRRAIRVFFDRWKNDTSPEWSKQLFENSPVFAVSPYSWQYYAVELNPILRPLEFFRVFGAYAAYQEIEMYLSNQAIPQKKMPEISDEMKALAHGFDKYSFRAEKKRR